MEHPTEVNESCNTSSLLTISCRELPLCKNWISMGVLRPRFLESHPSALITNLVSISNYYTKMRSTAKICGGAWDTSLSSMICHSGGGGGGVTFYFSDLLRSPAFFSAFRCTRSDYIVKIVWRSISDTVMWVILRCQHFGSVEIRYLEWSEKQIQLPRLDVQRQAAHKECPDLEIKDRWFTEGPVYHNLKQSSYSTH